METRNSKPETRISKTAFGGAGRAPRFLGGWGLTNEAGMSLRFNQIRPAAPGPSPELGREQQRGAASEDRRMRNKTGMSCRINGYTSRFMSLVPNCGKRRRQETGYRSQDSGFGSQDSAVGSSLHDFRFSNFDFRFSNFEFRFFSFQATGLV